MTCASSLRSLSPVPASAPTDVSALRSRASRSELPEISICSVSRPSKVPIVSFERCDVYSATLRSVSVEAATSARN